MHIPDDLEPAWLNENGLAISGRFLITSEVLYQLSYVGEGPP